MLSWRLLFGSLFIAAIIALSWLDALVARAGCPGLVMLPILLLVALLAGSETLGLAAHAQLHPVRWTVHLGNVLLILSNWLPAFWESAAGHSQAIPGGAIWPVLALGAVVLVAFSAEMARYQKPGGVTANVAMAVMAVVYVGFLFGFLMDLRMRWGLGALASLLIVVKAGDTGAYTVGRLIGRHKMAPVLSPGKTVEGAFGALGFSVLGAWMTFTWLVPWLAGRSAPHAAWWAWLAFGLGVGVAGMIGDLAESLLKRDTGVKDSSTWLPGLGGVLDMIDSILLAAPVAWFFWITGIVK